MNTTIHAHGPYSFAAVRVEGDDPFAILEISTGGTAVKLLRISRAECDELIRAALAARDLVPVPELPAYTEPPGIAHCGPGECTCGAHVTSSGLVIPPSAL